MLTAGWLVHLVLCQFMVTLFQFALLLLVALAPLLAAFDASLTNATAWPKGNASRRGWILALVVSFLLPPLGPLLAVFYVVARPRDSRRRGRAIGVAK